MEEWIEEFLYRGRPPNGPDSDKAPAFHIVIGQQVDSPFDPAQKQRRAVGPMSLEAAEAAGWAFEEIVAAMNTQAVKQCDTLAEKLAAAEAAIAERDAAIAERNGQLAEMVRETQARDAEIGRLSTLVSQQQAVIEGFSLADTSKVASAGAPVEAAARD